MDNKNIQEQGAVYMITEQQLAQIVEMTMQRIAPRQEEKRYITATEANTIYGVSATSLWRWQKMGLLHPKRVGHHRRFLITEIEAAISQ